MRPSIPIPLLLILVAVLLGIPSSGQEASANGIPISGPEVGDPFAGDARLEPIPAGPVHLANTIVFGKGRRLKMRFPPRVNGQTQSDGDKHADLFVFMYAGTGLPVAGQLPVVEAVPKGAAPGVRDKTARLFSAIWELHVVTVHPSYDPGNPSMLIDSLGKLAASDKVMDVFQTNMFLNCPVVPLGSTIPAGGSPPIEEAFFEGHRVALVPYDIEDGGFNPQVMFKFENGAGDTLPSAGAPHLVVSRIPGDPFYSSIWEVWTVTVPSGFDVSTLESGADVAASGFPVSSSGIRLNCPVVAIETGPGSGVFDPFPFEDAFALLLNDGGRFNPDTFRIDIPESTYLKSRTFLITERVTGGRMLMEDLLLEDGLGDFPEVASDFKGNVIPLILKKPFPLVTGPFPVSSGPNTTGEVIRFSQYELDDGYLNNSPPLLPAALEANFNALIDAGVLDPKWSAGVKPYQERLALVGQALFELVWAPEQGANSKDTTSCLACHSTPSAGGAARGLYTFVLLGGAVTLSPGSMWGSGGAELLITQKKDRGEDVTFAHGSLGQIAAMRGVVSGASNAHFGIQSTETFGTGDPDGDGVAGEMSAGEVTAMTAFLLSLPVPDEAVSFEVQDTLGITPASIARGRQLFRRSFADGGVNCGSCHTPFHTLESIWFMLPNPETSHLVPLEVSHHFADQDDVDEGLAEFVGQQGLRTYGDFKLHKMGPAMFSTFTDTLKTAELWDVGSTYPYLRNGSGGSDLEAAILAHGDEGLASRDAFAALSASDRKDIVDFLRAQLIDGKVGEGSGGELGVPDDDNLREQAELLGYAPLDTVEVPEPPSLMSYVRNKDAAIKLGKAFFWDQQMGSDGQACASCHFHAGADTRFRNQVNPGGRAEPPDSVFEKGPNYRLRPRDFPFHRKIDPTRQEVDSDNSDVVSSQGTFGGGFLGLKDPSGISLGPNEDVAYSRHDPFGFELNGIRLRHVEPRNTPTVINAVFNYRNFWDGRAAWVFNGVSPFGERDRSARVWCYIRRRGKLKKRRVLIRNASLASQAVGPPGSIFEMGAASRPFPMMGRKMLGLRPLGLQFVRWDDSVLGDCARSRPGRLRRGLRQTYATMIKKAFRSKWWGAPDSLARRMTGGFTQMEANFSLFWGLAIQCYESTLVSDQTPFDSFMKGEKTLSRQQKMGMELFLDRSCAECHRGPEFTGAAIGQMLVDPVMGFHLDPDEGDGGGSEEPPAVPIIIERMQMGDRRPALVDNGFFNIGVRPTSEDIGLGGTDPFGNPLSFTRQYTGRRLVDTTFLQPQYFDVRPGTFPGRRERDAVDGAFKIPGLRNVEYTGPFMHNGGMSTLEQVVEFYARRVDFFDENIDNVAPLGTIGKVRGKLDRVLAMAGFMRALSDRRVKEKMAPFDHPQLFVLHGHVGNHRRTRARPDPDGDFLPARLARDRIRVLKAIGAGGVDDVAGARALRPFLRLGPPDISGFPHDEIEDEDDEDEFLHDEDD